LCAIFIILIFFIFKQVQCRGDYLKDFAALYIRFASLGEGKSVQNNMGFFTRSLYGYLPRFRNETNFFHTLFELPKHAVKGELFIHNHFFHKLLKIGSIWLPGPLKYSCNITHFKVISNSNNISKMHLQQKENLN